jgi:hypothetical protein
MTTAKILPEKLAVYAKTGERRYADLADFGVGKELKSRPLCLPFSAQFLLRVKDPVGRELFAPVSVGELKQMVSRSEEVDTLVSLRLLEHIPDAVKELVLAAVYSTRVRAISKGSTTKLTGTFSENGAVVSVTKGAKDNRRELFRKDFVLEGAHEE